MGFFNNKKNLKRKNTLSKIVATGKGSFKDNFHDYCSSTSIHGIKYLGEKDRPWTERICWVFIFICCISGNGYLIRQVWKKWNDSPVIVSFAETTTPVWQVPFPAVTICSETKVRSTLFNFTYYIHQEGNITDEEISKKVGDVSLLCDSHVLYERGEEFTDDSTLDFLIEVSPPFSDTIWICKWQKFLTENCTSMFSQVVTEDGICYTFNMLEKSDLFRGDPLPYYEPHGKLTEDYWSLDGGYVPNAPLASYPYRALAAGAKSGLFIVMKTQTEDSDFFCRGPVQGFKVLLHNPAEIASVGERYLRVPLNQEVIVVVQPNIMTTSHGLMAYSPQRRQCYFPSERYLAYFKVYTQRNCELECLTNHTLKTCDCVAIHMPRMQGTPLCGAGKKKCMIDASFKLLMNEINSSYSGQLKETCDCLPACTSLQYNAESSQADFDAHSVLSAYSENLTEFEGTTVSRISIFFKDNQFTTSRRSELFGIVDFMANCGGLLGLFCGVSLLSLVEIVYYITLRFWGNIKKRRLESVKRRNKEIAVKQEEEYEKSKGVDFVDAKY